VKAMLDFLSFKTLRNHMRAFGAARGGNVIVIFALVMVPLLGFVGAAVDYSQASSLRAAMQGAVDSTALAMSKEVLTQSSSQLNQRATDYFNSLFNRPQVQNVVITPIYSTGKESSLIVTGSGKMKTSFMGIMGFSEINITAVSMVHWGNIRLRVALVLDNTGSMAEYNKMTALKTAAKNLLTQLKNAASQNGDVYVSIIPFAEDVNVDVLNSGKSWIRWDLWEERNGTCNSSSYTTKSTCVAQGKKWSTNQHKTWDGCVTDRDQNYDTTNTAPLSSQIATLFPAEQYGFSYNGTFYDFCPVPLMGLSYDWTALYNKIEAMQTNGFTNQAIGLQWGFQSLTNDPFKIPAKDSSYKYQEVIVLFTDGLNTSDRWYPYEVSTSPASIDARQKITCDNIKAAGITIYAVQVSTDGDPISALLQSCVTDPSKFYFLTSATQIGTIFDEIGTQLSQLRIAQ
jgi:putative Flp pilus-assembly TadE/G-like protein